MKDHSFCQRLPQITGEAINLGFQLRHRIEMIAVRQYRRFDLQADSESSCFKALDEGAKPETAIALRHDQFDTIPGMKSLWQLIVLTSMA